MDEDVLGLFMDLLNSWKTHGMIGGLAGLVYFSIRLYRTELFDRVMQQLAPQFSWSALNRPKRLMLIAGSSLIGSLMLSLTTGVALKLAVPTALVATLVAIGGNASKESLQKHQEDKLSSEENRKNYSDPFSLRSELDQKKLKELSKME